MLSTRDLISVFDQITQHKTPAGDILRDMIDQNTDNLDREQEKCSTPLPPSTAPVR